MAGAVLAAALVGGCAAGEPQQEPTETRTTEVTSTEPAEELRDEASDGAQLEVVESAFTLTEHPGMGPMVSYAVIVSNPSTDIALYTDVEIRLLDGDGEPVRNLDVGRDVLHTAASLVIPGQTQAIGGLAYVEHDGIESIDINMGDTKWASRDDRRFMPLTARGVVAEPDGDGAVVTFEVHSPYDRELTVSTYAIFRDSSGALLGGTSLIHADPLSYVPGVNDGEIDVPEGVPPDWDPASTEVYLDPFD